MLSRETIEGPVLAFIPPMKNTITAVSLVAMVSIIYPQYSEADDQPQLWGISSIARAYTKGNLPAWPVQAIYTHW